MKKLFLAIAAAALTAMPLLAQHPAEHGADPDKKMAGPGTLPSGWKGRVDSGDKSLAGVKASQMGGGVHFMTGPAGIYYKPSDSATGAYETHATFTQMEPAAHPEAYGLFIGGTSLDAAGQKYHVLHRAAGREVHGQTPRRRQHADDSGLDRQRRDQEAG